MRGIIIKGVGGFYEVLCDGEVFTCKPRGIFRKDNIKPCIGDFVDIELDKDGLGIITSILPRKNFLQRPTICNITQAVIVSAVAMPQINYYFLNKIILLAESIDIKIVLCFNKADLMVDGQIQEILDQFINTNYKFIFTSTKTGDGLNTLKESLFNEISVFSGASGVGKSSILNAIIPNLSLETGILSSKVERGKHTTRHVELFNLDNKSFIADTPGFSNIDITKELSDQDLMQFFPEFSQYLGLCKFNTCLHHKEPGCAVKKALKQGEISAARYEFYLQCINEIQDYSSY